MHNINKASAFSKHGADQDVHIPFFSDNYILAKSRLMHEFEMMEWLGKGGFGSVIKVRFIFCCLNLNIADATLVFKLVV